MDRYLLLVIWGEGKVLSSATGEAELGPGAPWPEGTEKQPDLTAAAHVYHLLKRSISSSINPEDSTFPVCSVGGTPGSKKWFFAVQALCGFYQFCSSDWDEMHFDTEKDEIEDTLQTNMEECLTAVDCFEEEDGNSRESLSLADLYEESAENLHQLSDKLPAPGRAMIDVLLLLPSDKDPPKLKNCLPTLGAFKHLREWHSAKITIAGNHGEISCQKIAEYLSANVVPLEDLRNVIDSKELWRGKIHIWERKFGSEMSFPDFSLKGVTPKTFSTTNLNTCFLAEKPIPPKDKNILPKVFHYYGPALEFVQMIKLSELPSCYMSDIEFELGLTKHNTKQNSTLLLEQISSLCGKVGALFVLPCTVSSILVPPPNQLSSRKWKDSIAKKPKATNVPDVEVKGECAGYYFLVQGNGDKRCKATLIYSANQINGSFALSYIHGKMKANTEETKPSSPFDFLSLPHFSGEQIIQREKQLASVQALALKECLKRRKLAEQPEAVSIDELKTLLVLTRDLFLDPFNAIIPKTTHIKTNQNISNMLNDATPMECDALRLKETNPLEWPERHVLQNLETFEKAKQKLRAGSLPRSSEQLLGHKEGPRDSITLLDAKELLKHFTSDGLPVGDLQPLQVQKREKTFVLTPELSPGKLQVLPFEKASGCHYHGIEYCLDGRKALERDGGFSELQSRLIRYETQTTCSREGFPIPTVLSPLPSPAVLSEPGSVPDGEAVQSELRTEVSRLKRRSKDPKSLYPKKSRLVESESSDSLLSQTSGSSRLPHPVVTSQRPQAKRSAPTAGPSVPVPSGAGAQVSTKDRAARKSLPESKTSRRMKESRSQKHTRILKEVVTETLKKHRITETHECFTACSQRLFEISKFYLKDLKTSRGLFEEMKKTANNNVVQVIEWVLEKTSKK